MKHSKFNMASLVFQALGRLPVSVESNLSSKVSGDVSVRITEAVLHNYTTFQNA